MNNTINSKSLRSLQEKVNYFLSYANSLEAPENLLQVENTFEPERISWLYKELSNQDSFDKAAFKCLRDMSTIMICESQMINAWGTKHFCMAQAVRSYIEEITKNENEVDLTNLNLRLTDLRKEQKDLIEASQKPNFNIPSDEPQYFIELFKAGSRDGYRSEWEEICKAIESANLNERCTSIVNEIIGYYSDHLDFMINTVVISDIDMCKHINEVTTI